MPDKVPGGGMPSSENLEEKMRRIDRTVHDALNVYAGYLIAIKVDHTDEDAVKTLKNILSQSPVETYMDYIKRTYPQTTQKEIDFYYPEYDSKMQHFQDRLTAPDVTRKELLDLFDDLIKYVDSGF